MKGEKKMFTGFWELLIVLILVIFLFGAKQIPKLTKTLKDSIDVFKEEKNKDQAPDAEKIEEAKNTEKADSEK